MQRALIWSCKDSDRCGGLGDEIKGLAFTLYAAIASSRPLFVEWEKMGQDVLQLFSHDDINVTSPDTLPKDCTRFELMNRLQTKDVLKEFMDIAHANSTCLTWVTNYFPSIMFLDSSADVSQKELPWLEHVKPIYAVGCAMRFLFVTDPPITGFHPTVPSSQASVKDPDFFSKLPQNYVVIHFRVPDSSIMIEEDDLRNSIKLALNCAQQKAEGLPILFLAGSQAAKDLAFNISNGSVMLSNSTPRHLDHDHETLSSADGLVNDVFQDFWAVQGAEYLFAGNRFSGFSLTAASMSFLPQDHVLDPNCNASWSRDDFEGVLRPREGDFW